MKTSQYVVMGSTPGDGGTVCAESFIDAAAVYFSQECSDYSKDEILQDLEKRPGNQISDKEYQIGDYTIRRLIK